MQGGGGSHIDLVYYERERDENPKKAQLWYKDFSPDVCIRVFVTASFEPLPIYLSSALLLTFFSLFLYAVV